MTLRRLPLLAACAALWLFLPAVPVLADGGPHNANINSGIGSLTADTCAGCHRLHTGKGQYLIVAPDPNALCLTCHDGNGATTDVVHGVQYVPATWTATPATDPIMGALRGGGISYALIDSMDPTRLVTNTRFLAKVPVLSQSQPVTSVHLGEGTAWGNGPEGTAGAGAGPADLECISCHNPHGNGQYRMLNTLPGADWAADGVPGWTSTGVAVEVADTPNPTDATRNYTVLPGSFATDVVGTFTADQGDYWRKRYPWYTNSGAQDPIQSGWDGQSPTNAVANGGTPPANSTGLMTAWCLRCHTRYIGLSNEAGDPPPIINTGDPIFAYRHSTMNYGCLQCHVSHGSNALMTGANALDQKDPGGSLPAWTLNAGPVGSPVTSGDSRLLKVGGRGTCQLCHDPTGTIGNNGYTGPTPSPGAP